MMKSELYELCVIFYKLLNKELRNVVTLVSWEEINRNYETIEEIYMSMCNHLDKFQVALLITTLGLETFLSNFK